MPFCRFCGKENIETARFCVGCGKPSDLLVTAAVPQIQNANSAQKKNSIYIILGIAGLLTVAAGIYFLVQNNKSSGKKDQSPTVPVSVADTQNAVVPNDSLTGTTTVPFTNNNPTVINGEDVYKGYETGKFPVYIKSIYLHNGKYYMDVDLVQVFEGDAVAKEMKQDGVTYLEQVDEIYVRNNAKTLRTYPIDPNCRMFTNRTYEEVSNKQGFNFMNYKDKNLNDRLFYIYLNNRLCYKMDEQFFS